MGGILQVAHAGLQPLAQYVVGGRVVFRAEGVVQVALAAVECLGDVVQGEGGVAQVAADVIADAVPESFKLGTKGMLRKKLYVIQSKATCSPEQLKAVLPRHLEYMIALEKQDLVFASGPLTADDGAMRGDGLTILRAASFEEARRIAAADPFYTDGLRAFEVREWTVMEGSIGIKVSLSDQSLKLA
jgi:uncharacterized protein YciI